MRPFVSRTPIVRFALVAGAWTIYGVLCACQSHYWCASSPTRMPWADSLRFELTYAWLWAACTPGIAAAARGLRYKRGRWLPNLTIHVALMAVAVTATRVAFDFIADPPRSMFHNFSRAKAFRSIESTFDTGALLYTVLVLIEHAILFHRRHQAELVSAAALRTRLVEAQLQALKMQLHPHFLFNTLHTIGALIHEDPDAAERTVARLGELLRLFLATSAIHEVPLREELRILDLYLEIERTRFEERLQVRFEVPDALRDAMVPNLVLQPLVENSIRHGVGRVTETGWIVVAAERLSERLVLRVTDNGEGLKDEPTEESMKTRRQATGLSITRGRLATLYGPDQSLALRNLPGGGVEASITLPFRKGAMTYLEKEPCLTSKY